MGRMCAWCGTVMPAHGGACGNVSHAICVGCFEELEAALRQGSADAPSESRPEAGERPAPGATL